MPPVPQYNYQQQPMMGGGFQPEMTPEMMMQYQSMMGMWPGGMPMDPSMMGMGMMQGFPPAGGMGMMGQQFPPSAMGGSADVYGS